MVSFRPPEEVLAAAVSVHKTNGSILVFRRITGADPLVLVLHGMDLLEEEQGAGGGAVASARLRFVTVDQSHRESQRALDSDPDEDED